MAVAACSVSNGELPRTGTCDPFQLTGVSPLPDSRDVAPDVALAATFSDFPDPETVHAGNILLYSGFFYHTGRFWVDLVERRAFFKPSSDLRLGLGYTFVVKSAIRSLRGCRLQSPPPTADGKSVGEAYDFRFNVVDLGANRPPTPLPPAPPNYRQVISVFAGHCAGGACHLAPDAGTDAGAAFTLMNQPLPAGADPAPSATACLSAPGGGLSLCARDARAALVGVPSRQVSPLVLVATRDSARSYLLRKIVGAPPLVGHSGVPNDNLSQDDKHVIQDWIDTGAPGAPLPAQASDGGI